MKRDGEWYLAYCPQVLGADGQGRSEQERIQHLVGAIRLIAEKQNLFA
jgi:hypothetical protein